MAIEIPAHRTMFYGLRGSGERARKWHHARVRFLQQPQNDAPRAPLPEPRQPCENLYQRIKFWTAQMNMSPKNIKVFCFFFSKKKSLLF
jgi:hypothetical protein